MHFANRFLRFFILSLLAVPLLIGKEGHTVEAQPIALEQAVNLSYQGVLKQKENGFVYLGVSNDFVNKLTPLLDHPGLLRPRPTASRSIGAHISVFYEKEEIVPSELCDTFDFSVKEIRSFTNHTRDGLKKLWVITVDSPELEALRERYGCSAKPKGHDFHITLGKQMPSAPAGWESVEVLSDFNFSDEPTEGLFPAGDFVQVENPPIIELAERVDNIGQLHLKGNGFVYVDVSDRFVEEIAPLLPVQSTFKPLSTGSKKMGAHISVIHEDEMIGKEIWSLEQAGEWFTFEVKELRFVERKTRSGFQRLWLLAVDAPALERLRTHYGLKPKLLGHDFHITLGYERCEIEEVEMEPAAA